MDKDKIKMNINHIEKRLNSLAAKKDKTPEEKEDVKTLVKEHQRLMGELRGADSVEVRAQKSADAFNSMNAHAPVKDVLPEEEAYEKAKAKYRASSGAEKDKAAREMQGAYARFITVLNRTNKNDPRVRSFFGKDAVGVKDELSSDQVRAMIKGAPIGSQARGGGYGPYIKKGSNYWLGPSPANRIFNDSSLSDFLMGFSDFRIR